MIHSATPRCILHPPIQPGASETKETLHTYFTLGRTNKLRHMLSPEERSVELRLRAVLANMYSHPFPTLEEAKESFYSQLRNIYPIIPTFFQDGIETAQTVEASPASKTPTNSSNKSIKSIRDISKEFFRSSERDARNWTIAIRNHLNSNIPTPSLSTEKKVAVNIFALRQMWRTLSTSDLPFKELKDLVKEKIKNCTLPDHIQKLYNTYESTTDLTSLKAFIESRLNNLNTEVASNSPPVLTVKSNIEKNLRSIWNAVIDMSFTDIDSSLDFIQSKLNEHDIFPGIIDLYMKDLHLASGVQSIKNRAQRYLQDLVTIKSPINLNHTSSGDVGHPMLIDLQSSERISGFMKFLESKEEISHNRLYSWILDVAKLPLRTPQGAGLDHSSTPVYIKPNGKRKELSREEALYIKDISSFIATANAPRRKVRTIDEEVKFQREIKEQSIGLFEKVIGENLETFILTSYNRLDKNEKEIFFTRLGMICYLDLLLANQDRLALFDMDNPAIQEDPLAANLGNIMIPPDRSAMYLIDNGINNGRTSSSELTEDAKQKYIEFSSALLSTTIGKRTLATMALKSLLNGFEGLDEQGEKAFQIDLKNALLANERDLDLKIVKAKAHIARLQNQQKQTMKASAGRHKCCSLKEQESNYKSLVLDRLEKEKLKLFPLDSLITGMQVIEEVLVNQVIPQWNSPETTKFKETFSPEFVDMITNRLNSFTREAAPSNNFQSLQGV